jgi:hypothetical protein
MYNESTSAFEKHGVDTITSATFDDGSVSGTSGTCTLGHPLIFEISGTNVIDNLNTLADSSVTSANTDLDTAIEEGVSATSGSPDVSATTNEVNMKISLVISINSPVIKTNYNPLSRPKPTDVVTR